jgi:Mg-chelatase subunit ChlD
MIKKYEAIKKIFLNKYFTVIFAAFLVILIIIFIALLNPLSWFSSQRKIPTKKILSADGAVDTTAVYGVEMQNKCRAEFQDFIKNYGADYSKCLVNFNFNNEDCTGFDPATKGLSDVNIIVILDASGSMAEKIGPRAKIDVAKQAISDFLTAMPQGVNTGLVVYGYESSNSVADKSLSCKGIEEVVKLGKNNSSNIIAAMDSFSPKGWTPIAGSLDFVKNIFKNSGASDRDYLVLVSDGIESCDGDPLTSAENLKSAIPNVKLNIIGFTTDNSTRDFLKRIATGGGGSYLTASNSSDMAKAFNDELLVIKKDCINITLSRISSEYSANNLNNLNCWLAAYEKEANDFTVNILNKSNDEECNLEMSNALQTRQDESWYEKEALIEKDADAYKKIESDFNSQLQVLDNSKN